MPPMPNPSVSVIVPCFNECDHIESCVRSLLAQQQPPGGFELIVVDGFSTDGTRELLAKLSEEDHHLRVVDNPQKITPCAMNIGIRIAAGSYIAILGAHNRYAPDYLLRSWEAASQTGADNVGGSLTCEPASLLQTAIAAAHHSFFSVGGARWHRPNYEGPADTVFGGFYKAEVFDKIGLFDEELVRNQDDELNLRLTRAGGHIWQCPKIKSWYHPRGSLKALLLQYAQYGYWKVRVIQKHRLPASWRHLVPGLFLLSLVAGAIASPFSRYVAALWIGVIGSYLAVNLGVSIFLAAKTSWRTLPLLPLVFACFHFGYGYGFLRGILDFLVLKRHRRGAFSSSTRKLIATRF
jgi:succinoglycan biosynthesis protein ExoA